MKKNQQIIKRCSKWKIFPFKLKKGVVALTETGFKPLNSDITDFGQMEFIITGKSPVKATWKNSTSISQKNKGTTDPITHKTTGQDQFYTKQYKVGDFWNAYLIEDISGLDFSSLNSSSVIDFKTLQTKRTYTLAVFEEHLTVKDYLQYFVVFNDENENIGGNTGKNQDRQLLYLSNATNYYSPFDGSFAHQVLTFSSVNDRAVASGQSTLNYVQYGSAGSGYAFPTIQKGIVTLNRTLMRDIGVRYAHRQAYGIEALSSCYYFGRPIIQGQSPNQIGTNEIFEQKVFSSRRIFTAGHNEYSTTKIKDNGGLFAGINDPVTTNSHPETTFYNIMDAAPTGFLNYADWQSFLAAKQFNFLAEKSFKGILAFDKTKAIASNGSSVGEAKFFWDSEWTINNLTGTYNVEMSSNFRYKDPNTNKVIGSSAVDYSKITQKWMSAILNFNSLIFSPLIQMPYDKDQWLPFALNSIPLIGKMLNALTLGIPVGFIITQNFQQYKKMLYFNAFMSAFFTSAMDNIFGKAGLIPLNLFSSQNNNEIGKLLGAKVSTTAILMKLSDRLSVYPWDPTTGLKLKTKEQISSVDLSQKRNNKIYIMDEESEFLDIASPLTTEDTDLQWNPTPNGIADGQQYAYIIDTIVTQSLHQGEERHTFYSDNPYTYQGDYNEISVAQFRYNSTSTLTDNLFNWMTVFKLNHDEYEESEQTTFSYPASILPPDPMNVAKPIIYIPPNPTYSTNFDLYKIFEVTAIPKLVYNPIYWNTYIEPNIKELNIPFNIKSLVDPTFFIKTFSDLKRFYKSIEIYLEWDYETVEYNSNNLPYIHTSETFGTKKQIITKSYNLDDLQTYTDIKQLITNQDNYYIEDYTDIGSPIYTGLGTMGKTVNNINKLYSLLESTVYSKRDYINIHQPELNKSNKSNIYLGFKNLQNDSLNFTIQLFPIYLYTNISNFQSGPNLTNYLVRYVNKYSLTISKIILNPR